MKGLLEQSAAAYLGRWLLMISVVASASQKAKQKRSGDSESLLT